MITVGVDLGEKSYNVYFEGGLLGRVRDLIDGFDTYDAVCVVSDSNVFPLYGRTLCDSLGIGTDAAFVFEAGEKSKNASTVMAMYEHFCHRHLTRQSLLIALGGGVVGDLCGFAAATYMRGIDFVQVPTTLLAMTDSSIGGKTGFDLPFGKNLVGAFWQPRCVICDLDVLSTLPEAFVCDGMAEVIKYAMIADSEMFDLLAKGKGIPSGEIIARCARIKADIVSADEHEGGKRKLLNFGHTVGHAIEKCQNFCGLTHGAAVAVGMAAAALLGENTGFTKRGTYERLCSLLGRYNLPLECDVSAAEICSCIAADKKCGGGKIDFILCSEIGVSRVYKTDIAELEKQLLKI